MVGRVTRPEPGVGRVKTQEQSAQTHDTFVFRDASIRVTIDLHVYRLTAVQKAAYRCADRCTAVLGTAEGERLPITFAFRPQVPEADALEAVRLFFQELLDQELREKIGEETRAIRALILAQAFSRTDLIRRD
jgi:His-Xaa-Ser system protein HxsD